MSIYDKSWKYRSAEETRKPGYLKERFDEIRRQQKEEQEKKNEEQVVPIRRGHE